MGMYETQSRLVDAMYADLYEVMLEIAQNTVDIVADNVDRYVYKDYPDSGTYFREYDNNPDGSFWGSWDWENVTRHPLVYSFKISSHANKMTSGAREYTGLGFPLENIHSSFSGMDYRPYMAQAVAEGWLAGWNAGNAEIARDYMTPAIEEFESGLDNEVLRNYRKLGVDIHVSP